MDAFIALTPCHGVQVDQRIRQYTLGDLAQVGGEEGLLDICMLALTHCPCQDTLLIGPAAAQLSLLDAATSGIFDLRSALTHGIPALLFAFHLSCPCLAWICWATGVRQLRMSCFAIVVSSRAGAARAPGRSPTDCTAHVNSIITQGRSPGTHHLLSRQRSTSQSRSCGVTLQVHNT